MGINLFYLLIVFQVLQGVHRKELFSKWVLVHRTMKIILSGSLVWFIYLFDVVKCNLTTKRCWSLPFPPLCLIFFFFFFFPFFLSFHCYHSVTGAWMSLCVGAHSWVAGISSHGSVLLSRGWLITVQARGHPGYPPSTQLDAVVNLSQTNLDLFLQLPLSSRSCNFVIPSLTRGSSLIKSPPVSKCEISECKLVRKGVVMHP